MATKLSKTIHIRLPDELRTQLEIEAASDYRKLSDLIRMVLTQWHESRQQHTIHEQPAPYNLPTRAAGSATKKRNVA